VNTLVKHELVHPDGRRVLVYGDLAKGATLAPSGAEIEVGGIHRRLDLLTREWVAISPARNVRPLDAEAPLDDAECPICPGGVELPFAYEAAVFENRFPALLADPPPPPPGPLAAPALGRCEMVVYTSRHDVSFGQLAPLERGRLLAMWIDRSRELWADERHELVLVFENRGSEAGATLAHPHGQIYAFDHLPPVVAVTADAHRHYRLEAGSCLGCALVDGAVERVVVDNETFAVAVPYASRWPYEVAVRARRHGLARLGDLTSEEQLDLMRALRDVALRYDALFACESPYLMVAQEASRQQPDWHLAFTFFPLQRSRTSSKIRASVETATGLFLNDVLPEEAARRLAALQISADPIDADDLFVVQPEARRAGRQHPAESRAMS